MRKLNQILKLFALGAVFVLGSCSKETFDEGIYQNKITVKKVSLKDESLRRNLNLMDAVDKVKQKAQLAQNPTSRMVYDSINNFYFDDENGKLVEKEDGYKSYTFEVFRENGDEKLENIVFEKKINNEYETYLFKYDYTSDELETLSAAQLNTKSVQIKNLENNTTETKLGQWIDLYENNTTNKVMVIECPCRYVCIPGFDCYWDCTTGSGGGGSTGSGTGTGSGAGSGTGSGSSGTGTGTGSGSGSSGSGTGSGTGSGSSSTGTGTGSGSGSGGSGSGTGSSGTGTSSGSGSGGSSSSGTGSGSSSSGSSGSSNGTGSSGSTGGGYGSGTGVSWGGGGTTTSPTGGGGGGGVRKTPCEKLKNMLDPTKGNIKPKVLDLLQTIPTTQGENGEVYYNSANGNISSATANQNNGTNGAGNYNIQMPTGGDIFAAIHTHPLDAYPMFSASDVLFLNTLNNGLATHNADNAIFFLATIDDNGQNQLYAIMFNNDNSLLLQNSIDDILIRPENIGCTSEDVGAEMDKLLAQKYNKQYNLGSTPNYERSFLHQMFGYNVSLYKANSNLTNFSRLKVNSLTGNVATLPCN